MKTQKDKISTDDLLLRSLGTIAEVLREDNQFFFVGRVASYDPMSQELRVDLHRGKETPQGVLYGAPVKVQLHIKGQWDELLMIYGKVLISALDHWRIQVEHAVVCEEARRAFRQKLKIEGCLIRECDKEAGPPCVLEDISVVGVGFHTKAELEVGDLVTLLIPPLTKSGSRYELLCRVVVRETSVKPGQWRYGCNFERLDQQTEGRLLKEILQLQARTMSREKI